MRVIVYRKKDVLASELVAVNGKTLMVSEATTLVPMRFVRLNGSGKCC
jgi:hypothetical protein